MEKERAEGMMATHQMKLSPFPFQATERGLKTIEIRLLDEKRKLIKVGDQIEFEHSDEPAKRVLVRVTAIRPYKTLADLISSEPLSKTGGIYESKAEWANHIRTFYSESEQVRHGFIAIEMELASAH